jgi:hypothetical protein
MDAHALFAMKAIVEGRHDRTDAARHQPGRLFQDGDGEALLGRDRRQFEADIAAPYHDEGLSWREARPDGRHVGDIAQVKHPVEGGTRKIEAPGTAAGGDDQGRVGKALAAGQHDGLGRPVDPLDPPVEH